MAFSATQLPDNMNALGVLGYLIVANKQVHSYQIDALNAYLQAAGKSIADTVLNDILNGSENSISYASSVSAFENEPIEVQSELIHIMYVLSFVDNSFDSNEQWVLDDVLSRTVLEESSRIRIKEAAEKEALLSRSNRNSLFERKRVEIKESFLKRFINRVLSFFRRLFKFELPETQAADNYDYRRIIEKCARIASEDFSVVKPAFERILDECADTINRVQVFKQSLTLETGLSAEVARVISTFVEMLNEDVVSQTRSAKYSLEQKERTVSDFTISLLGRTKAGKSTLHAILTGQGQENIGIGMQRTTRYNRVYQWNLLRIIDTPGIGSAEAEGRTDDEIAASVLGESDVICFVVADDSILQDILEFIEKIAKLNKPIIILLNHKENIKPEVKFKRFIAKPDVWLTTTDEAGLQGHINRIRKYADLKGFGRLISVFPVFLLPALMSYEPEYTGYSELLWKSSNIDTFINQLKLWIVNAGSIKRSQTIIDEGAGILKQSIENILRAESVLQAQVDSLAVQRSNRIVRLRKTAVQVENRIREFLDEKYTYLATDCALDFAEEEYSKKGNIEEDWKQYIDRIAFEKNVTDGIYTELNAYKLQAEDTVKELFEDFFFSVKKSFELAKIDIPADFNVKAVVRLSGAAIGVAGQVVLLVLGNSNVVGWVLTIVGVAVALLSNIFKSNEVKRQEKIDKIYNSIHDHIMKSKDSEIDKILVNIRRDIVFNIKQVDEIFDNLISGLKTIIDLAEKLNSKYLEELDWLNRVYGWRILQFVQNKEDGFTKEKVERAVIDINRSVPGQMTIVTSDNGVFETDSLNGIIAERVQIKRRG